MTKSTVSQAAGNTSTVPGTSLRITDMPAIIAALTAAVNDCAARPKGAAVTLKEGVGPTTVNQGGLKPTWSRAIVTSLPTGSEQERARKSLAQIADAKNADGLYISAGDMLAGLKVMLFQAKYLDERTLSATENSVMTVAKGQRQLIDEAARATNRKARLASVALMPFTAPSPYELARNPELFEAAMSRLAADQAKVEGVEAERRATHAATLEKKAANKPAPVAAPRIEMIPELAAKVAKVQNLNRRFCLNLAALVGCGYAAKGSNQNLESLDISTDMSMAELEAIEPAMALFEALATREVERTWHAMKQRADSKETEAKRLALATAKAEITRTFTAFNLAIGPNDPVKLPEGVELITKEVFPRTSGQVVIKCVARGISSLTVHLKPTAVRTAKNAKATAPKAASASAS